MEASDVCRDEHAMARLSYLRCFERPGLRRELAGDPVPAMFVPEDALRRVMSGLVLHLEERYRLVREVENLTRAKLQAALIEKGDFFCAEANAEAHTAPAQEHSKADCPVEAGQVGSPIVRKHKRGQR